MTFVVILAFLVIIYALCGMKVVNQYERGIVLTLGKYSGVKQPGLRIVWPGIQKMARVDVRSTPIDVPKQEVITKDNVTVNIDAVVYFRVIHPERAVLETTNYVAATSQFAQAALRDVSGNVNLDDLLSKRDEISNQIKSIVDKQTDPWGIDVEMVKLQNIELPHDMKRAMAREAEAERERRDHRTYALVEVCDGCRLYRMRRALCGVCGPVGFNDDGRVKKEDKEGDGLE